LGFTRGMAGGQVGALLSQTIVNLRVFIVE
jgi:hypothetical protein